MARHYYPTERRSAGTDAHTLHLPPLSGNNIFAKNHGWSVHPDRRLPAAGRDIPHQNINAHTGKRAGFIARNGGRISRFFNKFNDFVILIHGHDAKSVTSSTGTGGRPRYSAPFFNVIEQHPRIILFIDMVPGQNNDIFRIIAADNIQILVTASAVPRYQFSPAPAAPVINPRTHSFLR